MFYGILLVLKYLQCYNWIRLKFVLFIKFGLLDSECLPKFVLAFSVGIGNSIICQFLTCKF